MQAGQRKRPSAARRGKLCVQASRLTLGCPVAPLAFFRKGVYSVVLCLSFQLVCALGRRPRAQRAGDGTATAVPSAESRRLLIPSAHTTAICFFGIV